MSKGSLKIFGWMGVVILILIAGAVAGRGVVYALTQNQAGGSTGQLIPPEPGLVIVSVILDSPAAQAGVKRGDILLKIDDQPTDTFGQLMGYLQSRAVGDQVTLTLTHGDEERTFTLSLGDRNGRPYLGVVPYRGLLPRMNPVEQGLGGVTVINVTPDSPAAQAGLQPGDAILAVDGQNIDFQHSLPDLIAVHQPGEMVTLTVKSPGVEARQVTVTLNESPNQAGAAHLGVQFRPILARPFFGGGPSRPEPGDQPFRQPDGRLGPGALIQSVAENSPAAAAGLTEQELITAINGEPLNHPRDLVGAIAQHQPGDTITLTVSQPSTQTSREVTVTLAENPDQPGRAYLGVRVGDFFQMQGMGMGY